MLKNALRELMKEKGGSIASGQTAPGSDRRRTASPERSDSETADAAETGTPVETPTDDGPPVDLNQVFGLLRNRRRRDVLWYLLGTDEQVSLSDLAETIAARECDKSVSQITSQERKRVYIGLYQGHLPKMDDCGAVAYNQQRGTVDRGANFEVFVEYLPDDEEVLGTTDDSRNLLQALLNLIT